jgi:hypothetical protein
LIIVMTGTIEMLRGQTQRRIDMEMVGRQNIVGDLTEQEALEAKVDYQDDEDWRGGRFLDLETSEPRPEIHRLTYHHRDYQKHQFKTLKIDRFEPSRPLFDAQNLFRAPARLVVVKKNATVLRKLVGDIKANSSAFLEIPVLIIDDESDLASVNTVDPEKVKKAKAEGKEIKERRAINECIAKMLELMPRAQYVGYTATPFANVFCDPSDEQGIFPRDFLIGLRRPPGYMGLDDFHDLTEDDVEPTYAGSNKMAYVRMLEAADDEPEKQRDELARAIDVFVLAGAIKLYRTSKNPELQFRHHTMLVHSSVARAAHASLAEEIQHVWACAEFAHPAARARLKQIYEGDLVPVSDARLETGVPPLPSFEEVAEYIPAAITRITEHSLNPVIVVNSDQDIQHNQQALDFDRYSIWRILVGGAKLSRGFTVEGLTVTYFRRATTMSDSLTQMGRWFGFRQGYRDLVRLYIAQSAKFGSKTIDLYEAFESVALDEEAFRSQLQQYAEWDGDAPRLRPMQIPPLVSQHLPWLLPTAKNKMFNAVVQQQSEQPFTPSGYANRPDKLKRSLDIWRPALAIACASVELPESIPKSNTVFDALVGTIGARDVVDFVDRTEYLDYYYERAVKPKTEFYRTLMNDGLLDDFLVVVPQPRTTKASIDGVGPRSVVSRDRRASRGGKFGEITEPKHRPAVNAFISAPESVPELAMWTEGRRGAVVIYIAKESKSDYERGGDEVDGSDPECGLVVAFSVWVPAEAISGKPPVLTFRVRDETDRDAVAVSVPPGGPGDA